MRRGPAGRLTTVFLDAAGDPLMAGDLLHGLLEYGWVVTA
jgi:hypothetical protein